MRRHPLRSPETGARDAALRRLRILNRWLIAGSVTLTGVLAEVAAHTFPGKTVRTADTRHDSRRPGAGAAVSKGTAAPLRAPVQAPQAVNTHTSTTPSAEGSSSATTTPTEESAAPAEATRPAETTPTHEATATPQPTQEAQPAQEAPAQETAPTQETAPAPEPAEESTPVVSGGS
jgi:outer membrane biosynthesis protein TonB